MKKIKTILKSQTGMSLVEVIAAGAIAMVVSMAVLKINQSGIKGASAVGSKISLKMWQATILLRKLSDPQICFQNLGGINPATGGVLTELLNADAGNTVIVQADKPIAGAGGTYKLAPITAQGPIRVAPFVEDAVGSNRGSCDMEIDIINMKKNYAAESMTLKIPIGCTLNSGGNYMSCAVSTDGSDSLWSLQLANGANPEYIHSTKNVFIGPAGEQVIAPFQIDQTMSTLTEWPIAGSGLTAAMKITGSSHPLIFDNVGIWQEGVCLKIGNNDGGLSERYQLCARHANLYSDPLTTTFAGTVNAAVNSQNTNITGARSSTISSNFTNVSGTNSVGIASNGTAALKTVISGDNAMANGNMNTVSGNNSFASGANNVASGLNSSVFGLDNTVSGIQGVSFGNGNSSSGINSFTAGNNNTATGLNSVVLGADSSASGANSIALGLDASAPTLGSLHAKYDNGFRFDANPAAIGQIGAITYIDPVGNVGIGHNPEADPVAIRYKLFVNGSTLSSGPKFQAGPFGQAESASSIAMGTGQDLAHSTTASGDRSVAIGQSALASGTLSMALGVNNTNRSGAAGRRSGTSATGLASFAVGHNAEAAGNQSLAVGGNLHVQPGHTSSVMLGTSSWNPYDSDGPDRTYIVGEVKIESCIDVNGANTGDCDTGTELIGTSPLNGELRPIGNVQFGGAFVTQITNIADASAATAVGAYHVPSDKNIKKDIKEIDFQLILENLLKLDITTWKYKDKKNPQRYMGPMAQDFQALFAKPFGLKSNDKSIYVTDVRGVTLAATKALAYKTIELEEENLALKKRVEELEAKIEQILERL